MIWTPEKVVQVRAWADKGFSMADVARYLDVGKGAIAGLARRRKIAFHNADGPRRAAISNRTRFEKEIEAGLHRQNPRYGIASTWTPDILERAEQMAEQHYTMDRAAVALGVTYYALKNAAYKYGISFRRKNARG